MKRVGNLMQHIICYHNLSLAFYRAAKRKSCKTVVVKYRRYLKENLDRLSTQLIRGRIEQPRYRKFIVRDPKHREIQVAPFSYRVMQHAVMAVAGPVLEKSAAYQSHACRKGKGNKSALSQAVKLSERYDYVLKCDVKKFFESIDHQCLNMALKRVFKDAELLRLFEKIIASYESKAGGGLPIGSLCSQYLANFYLDELDRWVMNRMGARYVRFMDDFLIWGDKREELVLMHADLRKWLRETKKLKLKGKIHLRSSQEGVEFLGYRLKQGKLYMSKMGRRRFRNKIEFYQQEFQTGKMSEQQLQRRTDSLLAFTDMAKCRKWRRAVC